MSCLSKVLIITLIILGTNYFLMALGPSFLEVTDNKLISIFPPTWESLLNVDEVSFGFGTFVYLIFLILYAEKLGKVESKGIFSSEYYIILLNIVFIVKGSPLIATLFLIFYVFYSISEATDDEDVGVLLFAVALFPFSVFILLHKIHSPNLVYETVGFLFLLLGIRFYKNRIESK